MRQNKYFICSDIHSFFTPLKKALKDAGFNIKTKSHILVICGDIFDRGEETIEVYNFIRSLPKERRILIRGNHEYLLRDLYARGYSLAHDEHNGTVKTLLHFIGLPGNYLNNLSKDWLFRGNFSFFEGNELYDKEWDAYQKKKYEVESHMYHNEVVEEVIDWIMGDEWVDYYETPNYIFVHSFIPTALVGVKTCDGLVFDCTYTFDPKWREATQEKWEKASWGCPYEQWRDGLFKEDKTLVCGHWHTSDFWNELVYKDDVSKRLSVYKSNPLFKVDGINLIGLDACCAATKTINVLVLTEEEL